MKTFRIKPVSFFAGGNDFGRHPSPLPLKGRGGTTGVIRTAMFQNLVRPRRFRSHERERVDITWHETVHSLTLAATFGCGSARLCRAVCIRRSTSTCDGG